ncbi:hypothetical protein, partial [Brucella tritici]|uniref:hypothetical protein n=1 Tax=Brucella tritici TaxID=94626 RepID=UPI001AEE2C0B
MKRLKAHHRFGNSLDKPVILLKDVVERCCHVKFLWPERPGARRYSGETGRNFPCIESFEAMVANCVCGS